MAREQYFRRICFIFLLLLLVTQWVLLRQCSVSTSPKLKLMEDAPVPLNEKPTYFDDLIGKAHDVVNNSQYLRCLDPEGKRGFEDTLCESRFNFLPNYKNPCFVDSRSPAPTPVPRVRCLPYFHVLGVDKCGTTDLHHRLSQHPNILLNSGTLGKEIYYWCWIKYGQWFKKASPPQFLAYYLRAFDKPARTIASTTDHNGVHSLVTGDGTPMDFWEFRAWPHIPQNIGLQEPAVLTPHLMRHLYPNPKFIVILRDPVERMYSDYIFLRHGTSPDKFSKDVPKAIQMMENCLKVNSTRMCVFSNCTYVNLPMRLHIGMYSVFLKEWLSVFPKSAFYILRTEDWHNNMTFHLKAMFDFLELDPLPDHSLQDIVKEKKRHETKAKTKLPDMFPETRRLLKEFYKKYNEELAIIMDDTRFLWLPQRT